MKTTITALALFTLLVVACYMADKETAAKFEGAQCRGESFAVVTVDDFNNHQFTIR